MYRDGSGLGLWRDVPQIEACVRRLWKFLTSGPNGTANLRLIAQASGKSYLSELNRKFTDFQAKGYQTEAVNPGVLSTVMDIIEHNIIVSQNLSALAVWLEDRLIIMAGLRLSERRATYRNILRQLASSHFDRLG